MCHVCLEIHTNFKIAQFKVHLFISDLQNSSTDRRRLKLFLAYVFRRN